MEREVIANLVDAFKAKYGKYNGWEFDYEYPGFFAYYHDVPFKADYNLTVYFTPDYNEREL